MQINIFNFFISSCGVYYTKFDLFWQHLPNRTIFFAENKNVLERVELYFDIGSGEKLRCSIHNETNHARWVINGVKLEITNSTSQRIRAGDNGDLFIDDVQLSDGGTYECQRLEYVQYYIVYINGMKTNLFRM